ncbi:MAG: NADH-quinone oxidoreductase subunit NuoG [Syntrophobacteraceae bacterium]
MPKLIIDGLEIEVPVGTKVIEAAERLGIMIPRFCYHEGLGAVGACRMCAVKFLQGPFKGVQMSCMIEAQDGMVVSTTDEEAVAFRKFVIECLMLNHPHDCPVCDEGGQCLLQDETVSGGHGLRRYLGDKRTYRDQYLGPFIAHEMNRCIHCYRCARFYQEFSGYRDLGVMQIGSRVYFGRFEDGALESPFAGNLVDLCPTGVYTDKPSRFRARYWDMQRSPSVCTHCSLGCATTANARYREVLRIESRFSEAVNGHFICDRGRYGFGFSNGPDRPRAARIEGRAAPPLDVLGGAAKKLSLIESTHGRGAIATVGSGRASLETLLALKKLCDAKDWHPPILFTNPDVEVAVAAAVSRLNETLAVSLRDLERSDCIVVVGVDPLNEAPMLALALRQAFRKGAQVLVIDPRPVQMPLELTHLPLATADLEKGFADLLNATLAGPDGAGATALKESRFPVIVCGTAIVPASTVVSCAETAERLREAKGRAGLFYVFPEANQYAAALLSAGRNSSFADVVAGIETGAIRGLIAVEADLYHSSVDPVRLEAALERLDLLVVLDHLPTRTAERAQFFIPTANHFEAGSTFVNQEGRVQVAEPVYSGGVSIGQETGGSHPARVFRTVTPGSDPGPAARMLAQLAAMNGGRVPEDGLAAAMGAVASGTRIIASESFKAWADSLTQVRDKTAPSEPAPGGLYPLVVDWTFGTEELSSHSAVIQPAEEPPYLIVHADDAASAGLSEGDRVCVTLPDGLLELPLRTSANMAKGIVIVPRRPQIPWQTMLNMPGGIRLARAD